MTAEMNHIDQEHRLTPGERHAIWISAGVFLACLLGLFFIALFLGNELAPDNPFLPFVFYLAEVIAAISAGILAATISGFFKLEIERRLNHNGRIMVQATGGFAVFLIVMAVSPRHQMSELADVVFGLRLQTCAQGLADFRAHPDAEDECAKLAREHPYRPEPIRFLAQYAHRTAKVTRDFESAAQLYKDALTLYGVEFAEDEVTILKGVDHLALATALRGFAGARGDATLHAIKDRRTGEGDCSPVSSLTQGERQGLAQAESAYRHVLMLSQTESTHRLRNAAYDGIGKIALYRYFLDGGAPKQLDLAVATFDQALDSPSDFHLFDHYHRLIAMLALQERKAGETRTDWDCERTTLNALLDAISADIDSPANAEYAASTTRMLREMAENRRVERFELTVPFGSHCFGGPEFARFLEREPELRHRLELMTGGSIAG